jgi:hypothetical protein
VVESQGSGRAPRVNDPRFPGVASRAGCPRGPGDENGRNRVPSGVPAGVRIRMKLPQEFDS